MRFFLTLQPRLGPARHLCAGALLLGLACAVAAQDGAGSADVQDLGQRWLNQALTEQHSAGNGALRMEVVSGQLDSRLRLAPCARVEPYLPAGSRLWGRTRIGLRCVDGPTRWNVFLPVTVRAFGAAWVVKGGVAAGAVLTESDAMQVEVDWADEVSPVLAEASRWIGQVATRPLLAGQALRQGMVRPAQVFPVGAQVRVVAQGSGFQIASDGQALTPGVVGQTARVRMDSGRAVSGVVLDVRTVKIEL